MPPSPGQLVLAAAKKELGVHEVPAGSNRGPRVEFFQSLDWLAGGGYAWCVCFAWDYCVWHEALKLKNPYPTAAVFQLEAWARKNGWSVTGPPRIGDLMCFGGRHVTIFADGGGSSFRGLGGNQADQVKYSDYSLSSVTTKVRIPAKYADHGPPPKRPRFEIVRGEGEKARVVATVRGVTKALEKAQDILNKGGHGVRIRKVPQSE
jgi:hypothetical protein